jgi:hypothetical protein
MSGGPTVAQVAVVRSSMATLISAAAATAFVTLVSPGEFSFTKFTGNIIPVGAPVALGATAVNWTLPKSGKESQLIIVARGAIGGGIALAALMLAGIMPRDLNSEALTMFGIVSVSIVVGDMLVEVIG